MNILYPISYHIPTKPGKEQPMQQKEEAQVTVEVIPVERLYDAYQAKIEKLEPELAKSEESIDPYFLGMRDGIVWCQGKADSMKVRVPTSVMPKEEE